jgi:imidazolonepropionase-like amidohydrolase
VRPVRGIVAPALAPDGERAAFCAVGGLWLVTLSDGRARLLVRDGSHLADPAWSPDGTRLVYSSDRSGTPQLWVRDVAAGTEHRLTDLRYAAVAPAWSPDGGRIAFQDQDGRTCLVPADTAGRPAGDERVVQVLGPQWQPGRPSWSPDGARLAMAAAHPYSGRYREGANRILVVDVRTGAVARHEPAPHGSLSTRGDDGPVWSPDGTRMAFTMGGALHLLPVDAEGRPQGPARRLTADSADAPSWSADSSLLLHLHHGRLRLAAAPRPSEAPGPSEADGNASGPGPVPRTVPLCLPRRGPAPLGRTVIHAGRFWDGAAEQLREDVDVVLDGDRIAEIADHRPGRAGRRVDAAGLTVIPGLADMHVHPLMKGRFLGARQGRLWLSFGITTLRSLGDPAYPALEEREALAAGERLGPRYFAATEPIDGSRVHYGFMRPTADRAELARELERALALEPHLLKAYVRLGWAGQRALSDAAARHGIRVASHYLYPAALLGLDGLEHLGASNRLGHAQTMSRRGRTYRDVIAVLAASGMTLTPTLFASAVLLADEGDQWLTDRRISALYPPWEQDALRETVRLVRETPGAREVLDQVLASNVCALRQLLAAGGRFVSGTDAPIDHPALSLHLNLRAMVRHGLSPRQALTSATTAAAACLGRAADLGVLAPGRLADLTFVEGDPLTDITAASHVRMTMLAGRLHSLDDLLTLPTCRT